MKKQQPETHKFGFVILFPEFNSKKIQDTLKSIGIYYNGYSFVITCPKKFDKDQIKFVKTLGNIAQSDKEGLIDLFNFGISNSTASWNIVLIAGTKLKTKIDNKYFLFVKDEKDILFALSGRRMYFHESSLSGVMIHRNALKDIGEIPNTDKNIEVGKVLFEAEAQEKGYKFKGLACLPIIG